MNAVYLSVMVVGTAVLAAPPGGAPPAEPGPVELSLPDQFGRVQSLAGERGHVVILVFGDRKASDASRQVGEQLHVAFHPTAAGLPPREAAAAPVRPLPGWPQGVPVPDVKVIPVACTGKVPPPVRPLVLSQFRRAVPDVPVWVDMEEKLENLFGVAPGLPNVVILDTAGRYRYRLPAGLSAEQYQAMLTAVEQLRWEAAGGRGGAQ